MRALKGVDVTGACMSETCSTEKWLATRSHKLIKICQIFYNQSIFSQETKELHVKVSIIKLFLFQKRHSLFGNKFILVCKTFF